MRHSLIERATEAAPLRNGESIQAIEQPIRLFDRKNLQKRSGDRVRFFLLLRCADARRDRLAPAHVDCDNAQWSQSTQSHAPFRMVVGGAVPDAQKDVLQQIFREVDLTENPRTQRIDDPTCVHTTF